MAGWLHWALGIGVGGAFILGFGFTALDVWNHGMCLRIRGFVSCAVSLRDCVVVVAAEMVRCVQYPFSSEYPKYHPAQFLSNHTHRAPHPKTSPII